MTLEEYRHYLATGKLPGAPASPTGHELGEAPGYTVSGDVPGIPADKVGKTSLAPGTIGGPPVDYGSTPHDISSSDQLPESLQSLLSPSTRVSSGGGSVVSQSGGTNPNALSDDVTAQTLKGNVSLEQQQKLDASRAELIAKQQRDLLAMLGGSTGQSGPNVAFPQASMQAAQDAAFARAKDQAGLIAKSALTALRDATGQAGGTGGLGAWRTAQDVIAPAASGLGDINRQQLIEGNNAAFQSANAGYQGDIQQRGQNIGLSQSLLALLKPTSAY